MEKKISLVEFTYRNGADKLTRIDVAGHGEGVLGLLENGWQIVTRTAAARSDHIDGHGGAAGQAQTVRGQNDERRGG